MPTSRRGRVALVLLVAVLVLAGELRVFVFPPSDPVRRTDLVVVLGPEQHGDRMKRALQIVREHPGTTLLVSAFNAETDCPRLRRQQSFPDMVCFRPSPFTTRGEAEDAAAYAHQHGMTSMTVVTTPDQIVRAGVRFRRCFGKDLSLVWGHSSLTDRFSILAYQNLAMVKALVVERSC